MNFKPWKPRKAGGVVAGVRFTALGEGQEALRVVEHRHYLERIPWGKAPGE